MGVKPISYLISYSPIIVSYSLPFRYPSHEAAGNSSVSLWLRRGKGEVWALQEQRCSTASVDKSASTMLGFFIPFPGIMYHLLSGYNSRRS